MAIVLHEPRTVDTASSLPLLQEEELSVATKRYHGRQDQKEYSRFNHKPHNYGGKGILGAAPVEQKTENKAKVEERYENLRSLCRAQGLCMNCGEKRGTEHKCPRNVPLHVLEELMEVLQLEGDDTEIRDGDSKNSEEEILMSISQSAAVGVQGKRTIRLQGCIGDQEVLVLIDSGSSGKFISEALVQKCKLPHNQQSQFKCL